MVAAAGAIVVLAAGGGTGSPPVHPALPILQGPHARVEARLRPIVRTIATRVERLRGLRFERPPRVVVMGEAQLAAVGSRIARRQERRANLHPGRLHTARRLQRASIEFDQLAGLLPPESGLGPDTNTTGLDRIGGAFDYPRDRIIVVPTQIVTRIQLDYTLAHELTHALEDQHFDLRLGTLTAPGEAAEVRRAVIEGTATFVQDLYRHRYLRDEVAVKQRIDAMRSVIATGPSPYAVNAQAVFDYVAGGLFVHNLYRRTADFRLINRALRHPPRGSNQILHPRSWPGPSRSPPVRLGIASTLRPEWLPVGGGTADEQQALVILLAGTIGSEATAGASGWDGGRFAVWRPVDPSSDCDRPCASANVGVIAFRWRDANDVEQFTLAVPAYMTLGLLAEGDSDTRVWELADGWVGMGVSSHASALAFAPTSELATSLSRRAAWSAEGGR